MVSFIHFVIFVLFLKTCGGIKCADETEVQLSSSELTLTNIQKLLNDLKYSTRMKCQVYIEFEPVIEKLTIKFSQVTKLPRLRSVENVYINIITSIISGNPETTINQTSIKTKMYLICHNDNECDRQLILEYFDWLTKINYKKLQSTIRPLLIVQGGKKGTI